MKFTALFDGVLEFLGARGRFAARTAIHAGHRFRSHAQRHAAGVHGGIAGAHHGHPLAHAHRRIVNRLAVAAHQVDARQEFVGGEDSVERFAGNLGEFGRSRAGAHEGRVVAHFGEQLRDGEELADDAVEPDLDAHLLQVLDFRVDDHVRQAEFGDAVLQHAAGHVQRLENGHLHAVARQFAGAGQARRSGTDDGGRLRRGLSSSGILIPAAAHGGIGHEAFQAADGHRLELGAHHASGFALRFLRADAAANRRQGVGGSSESGRNA